MNELTSKQVITFSFFDEKEDFIDIVRDNKRSRDIENLKDEIIDICLNLSQLPTSSGDERPKLNRLDISKELKKRQKARQSESAMGMGRFADTQDQIYQEMAKGPRGQFGQIWIPSVSLARAMKRQKVCIDEYHLLYQPRKATTNELQEKGSEAIGKAIFAFSQINPVRHPLDIGTGHNFDDVYSALREFFGEYFRHSPLDSSTCEYYVHVSTGSSVMKTCLTILAAERIVPAIIAQTKRKDNDDGTGDVEFSDPSTAYVKYLANQEQNVRDKERKASLLKERIVTRNARFSKIIDEIEHVAMNDFTSPVLITGPTGAGKSELVKAIKEIRENKFGKGNKEKRCATFEHTNCAVLGKDIVDSELFGYEKGAFTGAEIRKAGLIEESDGGILFLDEIGSLPLSTQAKLLTVLDGEPFRRVGPGGDKVTPNFQLFCGTNEDLLAKVNAGDFRRDLWERIATWQFGLLGLKDRRDDIEPNIDVELSKFASVQGNKAKRLSGKPRDEFVRHLKSSKLDGNFRELHRMVWRMALMSKGDEITSEDVASEVKRHQKEIPTPAVGKKEREDLLHGISTRPSNSDLLSKLVAQESIEHLKSSFPLEFMQLAVVVAECVNAKSAADAGKKLFPEAPNETAAINQFFKRKSFLKHNINLTFKKIKRELS